MRTPDRLSLAVCFAVSAACLSASSQAQSGDELDLILNRLSTYLLKYETELSSVVAEERYEQRILREGRAASDRFRPAPSRTLTRNLESDVAFLRLPGGEAWFGVRDVRKVDGREVSSNELRLLDLLQRLDPKRLVQDAARIVAASVVHNLGGARTINMPTTPLEVLHPEHHVQFVFKMAGHDTIAGTRTAKVSFEEFDVPTIINDFEGNPLFIRGAAWVEEGNGRLWRAEMTVRPPVSVHVPRSFQSVLRVEFMPHQELGMMVPKQMYEEFFVLGGRGSGDAKYSNYRRFTTATRVLPPP